MTVKYISLPPFDIVDVDIAHNVSSLTGIWELPGQTAFTQHFELLGLDWPSLPIASAGVRYVGGSGVANSHVTSAQFVSLHYVNGAQVWENVGAPLTQRPMYTIDNQAVDVTAQIATWTQQRQIGLRVNGNGICYSARLELVLRLPDYDALEFRVAALEAGGGGGGLTLQQIRNDLISRLSA